MMLTSQSIPARTRPIKSLNASLPTQESKTPEIETVFRPDAVKETQDNEDIKEIELEKSSLSTRASKVKENLCRTEEIDAVLLKTDGSSQQIKCNTSSKQINKILNGRPTIIGELEEINAIILRSLKQTTSCKNNLNENVLPPPYCSERFCGNYLLFCVDSAGNPASLSEKQYQAFVDQKKDLIQKMRKSTNSVENRPISAKPTFDSDSKYGLAACLRSEFDKQIRMECEHKSDSEPTDVEIENYIEKSFQNFVDNLVFEMSANRMIDQDYDPEEDENEDPDYNPEEEEEEEEEEKEIETQSESETESESEKEKQSDWRIQLNEALHYVRERGKFDGGRLAEKIANTYSEVNGIEPTLDELVQIFSKIKSKYIQTESENGINNNNILDLKMFKTSIIKSKTGISETFNVYFNKVNKTRKEKNLSSAIKSFKMRNNREPTNFEIHRLKQFLFRNNETTLVQFKLTVVDDDDEKKTEIPKQKRKKTKLLVTPVKKKKNAARFNVYFDDESDMKQTENQAFKWFERFNNRKPTEVELNLIKQFVKSDNEKLTEQLFDVQISDNSKNDIVKNFNYEIDSVVEKKSSTKYTLDFNDKTKRKNGDKKQAIQWFTRFNNRNPTEDEKQNIRQFIQDDDQDIIDID